MLHGEETRKSCFIDATRFSTTSRYSIQDSKSGLTRPLADSPISGSWTNSLSPGHTNTVIVSHEQVRAIRANRRIPLLKLIHSKVAKLA